MFRKLFRSKGPLVLVSAVVIGLLASSFAMASGEGKNLLLGKRNPGSNASAALSSETQIIANNGTYGTRQSNKSDNGGGAIYGCRSKLGGSEKGNEPCVRASNLADGRAFEFSANGGTEVGRITSGNTKAAPFTTNATGVATGLNADQVDGKGADDIAKAAHDDAVAVAAAAVQGSTSFAAVGADGTLGGKRGATSSARTSDGNYNVAFASDISACAIQVTESTISNAGAASAQLGADKKTVSVRTRAGGGADGTGTPDVTDRPFHITVSC
ncbi:hypothetical protein DSM104299_03765 [Baekduia alba]|uniref:hypothetical protein n=1 Tax=Baekduia alba TaxID=2997333 RepID=UPI002340214B|nr:hypothetical protein [Baekduia alba]WCB95023.1 hypothetical protein DSM104299_03765 [Baekduia alba]